MYTKAECLAVISQPCPRKKADPELYAKHRHAQKVWASKNFVKRLTPEQQERRQKRYMVNYRRKLKELMS